MINFFIKICLCVLLLIIGQNLITDILPVPRPESINQWEYYLTQNPQILFLGDSTVQNIIGGDIDERNLGQMVCTSVAEIPCVSFYHMAYGSDVYLAYLRNLRQRNYFPKIIIIPIALRSFSPEWDKRAEYQFIEEKFILRILGTPLEALTPFFLRFGFINLYPLSTDQILSSPIIVGGKSVGTMRDFESQNSSLPIVSRQQRVITYHYLTDINAHHRKIEALLAISRLYENTPSKVIFYISPINYEEIQEYVSKTSTDLIKNKISIIKNELTSVGATVVDLSFSLPSSAFAVGTDGTVDDHFRQSGRQYVANRLIDQIKLYTGKR